MATLDLTGTSGGAIAGATVTVRPEYQVEGTTTWVTAADITGVTTATGSSALHSADYKRTGNGHIARVRFTVVSVATPQALPWSNVTSEPVTVVVEHS